MSDNAELSVRTYRHGDEQSLVELWGRAYSDYGGHVPKTPEYWRWCVLDRPGIEAEDIVLLEREGTLVAYGVLGRKESPVGPGGSVLEVAVEPSLPAAERSESLARLIAVLEKRSRARGDEIFEVSVPDTDRFMVRALEAADFKPEKSDSLQLVIVDLIGLIRKILARRTAEVAAMPVRSFALIIEQEEYRSLPIGRIRIAFSGAGVEVEDSEEDADHEAIVNLPSLVSLIFRRDTVERLLRSGAIRLRFPTESVPFADMLRLLAIRGNWYTPWVDGR